jgi:hypothetical protein
MVCLRPILLDLGQDYRGAFQQAGTNITQVSSGAPTAGRRA